MHERNTDGTGTPARMRETSMGQEREGRWLEENREVVSSEERVRVSVVVAAGREPVGEGAWQKFPSDCPFAGEVGGEVTCCSEGRAESEMAVEGSGRGEVPRRSPVAPGSTGAPAGTSG